MQVRVSSIIRAEELAKDWANFAVSLISPHVRELPKFDKATTHLSIIMEDTEIISDPWSPKFDDIVALFLMTGNKDHILVHCEGGISRSTAVGVGLLVSDGVPVEDAVQEIHNQSPNMGPNRLILSHIDRHLQLGGHLVQQVQDTLNKFPKDLQLWCNDCQVHFTDGENCPGRHWSGP